MEYLMLYYSDFLMEKNELTNWEDFGNETLDFGQNPGLEPPTEEVLADQANERIGSNLRRRLLLRAGIGAVSLIGLIRVADCSADYISNSDNLYEYDAKVNRRESLEGLEEYYGNLYGNKLSSEQIQERVLNDYVAAREGLIHESNYFLKTKYDSKTKEHVAYQRKILTIDGVKMMKKYLGWGDISLDEDKNRITIPGIRDFDINDVTDIVLLDQIVSNSIRENLARSDFEKQHFGDNKFDALWLSKSGIDLQIRNDTFAFPEDDALIIMSRFTQFTEKLGYPVPPAIEYVPYDGKSGYSGIYISYKGSDNLNKIQLNTEGSKHTPAHELAHHQAYTNPEFGIEKYIERVNASLELVKRKGYSININEPFITEYAATNYQEDYAETVSIYFMDGVSFRRKLKELYSKSLDDKSRHEYEILAAKYNFAKEFFGGVEFMKDGSIFNPKIYEEYRIDDPDPKQSAIPLRSNGRFEGSPETGYLHNGEIVKIVSEPRADLQPNLNIPIRFYLVESGGKSGWVSDFWFGDKIQNAKIPVSFGESK